MNIILFKILGMSNYCTAENALDRNLFIFLVFELESLMNLNNSYMIEFL